MPEQPSPHAAPMPDAEHYRDLTDDLRAALAALGGDDPRAWHRCRAAIRRYLDALRAGRFSAAFALTLLRHAVDAWAPPALDATVRARLEQRTGFWVGTVYGFRWRDGRRRRPGGVAEAAAAAGGSSPDVFRPRPGAVSAPAVPGFGAAPSWQPRAPAPGGWEQMRAWRTALAAERERLAALRPARAAVLAETHARALRTCAIGHAIVEETGRVARAAREWCDRLPPVRPVALTDDGAVGAPRVHARPEASGARPRPAGRLGDAELLALAVRIQRAVRGSARDGGDVHLLSCRRRLPPRDEARLELVLAALPASPRRD